MKNCTKPYIVGIGGANMDMHAKLNNNATFYDSNPGKTKITPGGVTRNIIDNLTRLGNSCILLTAIGTDLMGESLISACENIGIDMSEVFVSSEYSTGNYLAIINNSGELVISACDTSIIENIPLSYFESKKEIILNADAIVCDPNLETIQLQKIGELAQGKKIYLDPTSGAKAEKIKDILNIFYFIKPNLLELEILSGIKYETDEDIIKAANILLDQGLNSIAVSLGERGCYYADKGHSIFKAPVYKPKLADATGAGDAFIAAFIDAQCKNLNIEEALDRALIAGAIAAESTDTISFKMSSDLLNDLVENQRS